MWRYLSIQKDNDRICYYLRSSQLLYKGIHQTTTYMDKMFLLMHGPVGCCPLLVDLEQPEYRTPLTPIVAQSLIAVVVVRNEVHLQRRSPLLLPARSAWGLKHQVQTATPSAWSFEGILKTMENLLPHH